MLQVKQRRHCYRKWSYNCSVQARHDAWNLGLDLLVTEPEELHIYTGPSKHTVRVYWVMLFCRQLKGLISPGLTLA